MSRRLVSVVLACGAALAAAPAASAAPNALGRPSAGIVNRSTLDTASNFSVLDTQEVATGSGAISKIDYYAGATGTIRFFLTDASNKVKYLSPAISVTSTGRKTYTLATSQAVATGDRLGYHTSGQGVIPFDSSGSNVQWSVIPSSPPSVGTTMSNGGGEARIYSFGAQGEATAEFRFVGSNKVGRSGVGLFGSLENTRTDGRKPATLREIDVFLPKQLQMNGKRFRSCTLGMLSDPDGGPEACPRASLIGEGSATRQVTDPEPATETEPATPARFEHMLVRAFNGPGGQTILFFLNGTTIDGTTFATVVEGTLSSAEDSASFGRLLRMSMPSELQQPAPRVFTPLVEFSFTLKAKRTIRRKKVAYVEMRSCSKKRRLAFRTISKFDPDSGGGPNEIPTADEVANATAVCRK